MKILSDIKPVRGAKRVGDHCSRYFKKETANSDTDTILRPEVFIKAVEMQIEKTVRNALGTEAAPSHCPDNEMYVPACARSQVIQWGHSSQLWPPGS